MKNPTLRAIATLVGATIGAGIFGIPYVVAKVGFLTGVVYLLTLGLVILLLNLIYGEVILRTPGDHQLTGYGEIYLGKTGKLVATLSLFIGLYGALLAYLIKIGEFLALILGLSQPILLSLLFFVFAAGAIFFGLKTVSALELVLVGLILSFIATLTLVGLPLLSLANLGVGIWNLEFLFLPYGVILFALAGSSVIPEMEEILRQDRHQLKKAIVTGTLIPLFVYLLFAITVVGISGPKTSDDAISSLVLFLPSWIVNLGAGLGILTMSTSFLALGYVLREVWHRDFKLPKLIAFSLACFPSLILFLLGTKSFIRILELTGALMGGLTGILIVFLYRQAEQRGRLKPAYQLKIPTAIYWFLGAIFLLGMFAPLITIE